MPGIRGSWSFGAVAAVAIIAAHWFAYRVAKARRLARKPPARDGISNNPLTPE